MKIHKRFQRVRHLKLHNFVRVPVYGPGATADKPGGGGDKILIVLFVCVEVLRPSQPNGVMSSAVSLPNHTFTGQA